MKRGTTAGILIAAFITTGWCVDDAVLKGKVTDSTGAAIAGVRVVTMYPLGAKKKATETNASGEYEIQYPGAELLENPFLINIDTIGGLQFRKSSSYNFPASTNHYDGVTDVVNVPDFITVKLPGPYDTVVISGTVNKQGTTDPFAKVPVKIRWQLYCHPSMDFVYWDTLVVTTAADGSYLIAAPNRFAVRKVYCWVDTTPGICFGSKQTSIDSLPAGFKIFNDLFDGKKDSIRINKIMVKPMVTIYPTVISSAPGVSRVSVSFYALDGRLIRRVGDMPTDRIAAIAETLRPAGSAVLIAAWRENGVCVSRRIHPAFRK